MKKVHEVAEFTARELVPSVDGWNHLADLIDDVRDIVFLGKFTIREMINAWAREFYSKTWKLTEEDIKKNKTESFEWGNARRKHFLRYLKSRPEIKSEYEELKKLESVIARKMNILRRLKKEAVRCPPIPCYRPNDWFKEGDKVAYKMSVAGESWQFYQAFFPAAIVRCYPKYAHIEIEPGITSVKTVLGHKLMGKVFHRWEVSYLIDNPKFDKVFRKISDLLEGKVVEYQRVRTEEQEFGNHVVQEVNELESLADKEKETGFTASDKAKKNKDKKDGDGV